MFVSWSDSWWSRRAAWLWWRHSDVWLWGWGCRDCIACRQSRMSNSSVFWPIRPLVPSLIFRRSSAMVPIRRKTSWRAVTSLLLLIVSAAARVLFVAVSVATDTRLLAVAVAKIAMALTVSCRYTWLAAWWSTRFAAC